MPEASAPSPRVTTAPSIRTGTLRRKPWVPCTGTPEIRQGQAIFYLTKAFDHEAAFRRDLPTLILAKVVCNLRNYFLQDQESTVHLILTYFNPRCWDEPWSPAAVRLMWSCVKSFTPSLGLDRPRAKDRQRARCLQEEVAIFLERTVPGGRVLDDDLLAGFLERNPDLVVTSNAFTRAVKAVTGLSKDRSNGEDYWVGFHLPTAGEGEAA